VTAAEVYSCANWFPYASSASSAWWPTTPTAPEPFAAARRCGGVIVRARRVQGRRVVVRSLAAARGVRAPFGAPVGTGATAAGGDWIDAHLSRLCDGGAPFTSPFSCPEADRPRAPAACASGGSLWSLTRTAPAVPARQQPQQRQAQPAASAGRQQADEGGVGPRKGAGVGAGAGTGAARRALLGRLSQRLPLLQRSSQSAAGPVQQAARAHAPQQTHEPPQPPEPASPGSAGGTHAPPMPVVRLDLCTAKRAGGCSSSSCGSETTVAVEIIPIDGASKRCEAVEVATPAGAVGGAAARPRAAAGHVARGGPGQAHGAARGAAGAARRRGPQTFWGKIIESTMLAPQQPPATGRAPQARAEAAAEGPRLARGEAEVLSQVVQMPGWMCIACIGGTPAF
jgi:hypothetical protein